MSTDILREKLHRYIERADQKKVKAFYNILESEILQEESDDDDQLKELNKRTSDFESGKVVGYTWAEVKQRARKSSKAKAS